MLPAQFCPSVLNPVYPLSRLSLPEFQVGIQIPKRLIHRPGNLSVHNPMYPMDKVKYLKLFLSPVGEESTSMLREETNKAGGESRFAPNARSGEHHSTSASRARVAGMEVQSGTASSPHSLGQSPSGTGVDGGFCPGAFWGNGALRPSLHILPSSHYPPSSACLQPAHSQPPEKLTVCRPLSARGRVPRVPAAGWLRGEMAQKWDYRRKETSLPPPRDAALSAP